MGELDKVVEWLYVGMGPAGLLAVGFMIYRFHAHFKHIEQLTMNNAAEIAKLHNADEALGKKMVAIVNAAEGRIKDFMKELNDAHGARIDDINGRLNRIK